MKRSTKESIDMYVEHHIPTGGFLQAVLENNLCGAVGHADEENLRDLKEIVGYIYNEIPAIAWGDRSTVQKWLNEEVDD